MTDAKTVSLTTLGIITPSTVDLDATLTMMFHSCYYAECRNGKCHYAECHYAECHYAQCRGATSSTVPPLLKMNEVLRC